jgi:hypothetical protein
MKNLENLDGEALVDKMKMIYIEYAQNKGLYISFYEDRANLSIAKFEYLLLNNKIKIKDEE